MWRCPACETINKDDKCTICGEPKPLAVISSAPPEKKTDYNTSVAEPLPPAANFGNIQSKTKHNKKMLIGVIVAVLVLALAAIVVLWITNINTEDDKSEEKVVNVGDYITFGKYEQDNNLSNGAEDIEWLVLARDGDKALIISKYALDCQLYNEECKAITWAECTLRAWLNDEFYNTAFLETEKAQIHTTTVLNKANDTCGTYGGIDTHDKVFLHSIDEAYEYFRSDGARECKPTPYAVANGAYVNNSNGNCWWWLRASGNHQHDAASVYIDGGVDDYGYRVDSYDVAVRPSMWINLE